jgi:inhibitor of cysteine peptidase
MMRIVLAAVLLIVGSCQTKPAVPRNALTMEDNGSAITLSVGDPLTMVLTSNHSTGYEWIVLRDAAAVLQQNGEREYDVKSGSGDGAGGHETWRYMAIAPGEATLELGYHRPWEEDQQPIQLYTLRVTVRE